MPKFTHIADVHLGGWKQKPLQDLNLLGFEKAIDFSIKEKVNFVLIAGDLFDSPYPSIDILKEAFYQFKKLSDSGIPCFIISGSHDYSVSGKTFLDVLEKAGFCKNVENFEEREDKIVLNPYLYQNVALYGYPGRKSGLEVQDIKRIKLNDSPGMFKILMLHTTLDKVKGNLPIDSVDSEKLPKADYYAMGHIHIDYQYENFVYPGPIYPNNFAELEDLEQGSFYLVDTSLDYNQQLRKIDLKLKEIVPIKIEISDAIVANEKIIAEIDKSDILDKIVLLRIYGEIENGKNSDIKFQKIEDYVKERGAYFLLKNTHDLKAKETEIEAEFSETENVEEEVVKHFSEENPSDFNDTISLLIDSLSVEKQEGETSEVFSNRLLEDTKKILKF
jgi:hypothetical protein